MVANNFSIQAAIKWITVCETNIIYHQIAFINCPQFF